MHISMCALLSTSPLNSHSGERGFTGPHCDFPPPIDGMSQCSDQGQLFTMTALQQLISHVMSTVGAFQRRHSAVRSKSAFLLEDVKFRFSFWPDSQHEKPGYTLWPKWPPCTVPTFNWWEISCLHLTTVMPPIGIPHTGDGQSHGLSISNFKTL